MADELHADPSTFGQSEASHAEASDAMAEIKHAVDEELAKLEHEPSAEMLDEPEKAVEDEERRLGAGVEPSFEPLAEAERALEDAHKAFAEATMAVHGSMNTSLLQEHSRTVQIPTEDGSQRFEQFLGH